MERTLLLSQSYEPLSVIAWKRAIKLLCLERVEVVEEYDSEIHSAFLVIKVPAVVRLLNRIRRPKQKVRYSKHNVFARDWWKCQYCGIEKSAKELTLDHVIPRGQGGTTRWENVVACCAACNSDKGNRTPRQAKMKLLRKPVAPTWIPAVFSIHRKVTPDKWNTYMFY